MTPECIYKDRGHTINQKCGGNVVFFVEGYLQDGSKMPLCYQHKKFWNKYRESLKRWPWVSLKKFPIARKQKT